MVLFKLRSHNLISYDITNNLFTTHFSSGIRPALLRSLDRFPGHLRRSGAWFCGGNNILVNNILFSCRLSPI
jgi:hypothetical protein